MSISFTEWDFGNHFTGNMFSVVFFLSFCFNRILIGLFEWFWIIFFIDLVLGISGCDIVDRFLLHIYDKTESDNAVLTYTIILTALWLFISQKHVRRQGTKE